MSRASTKQRQNREIPQVQGKLQQLATLASTESRGASAPIVVLDDDDDIQITSPRAFALARSLASDRNNRDPEISEADLELRLGPSGRLNADIPRRRQRRVVTNTPIIVGDDVGDSDQNVSKKKKIVQPLNIVMPPSESKEVRLTCAICMNTMEEETSTVCGHIFCRKCITSAIQFQKKCPTCRRALTVKNIHRIYLPST